MLEAKLIEVFLLPLNQSRIEYVVTGSIATTIYGEPRMTHDIDLVVNLSESQIDLVEKTFPEPHFYCPPKDALLIEIARENRAHFNLIHHDSGFKADIYPIGNDLLHHWALQNKKEIALSDKLTLFLAPPEYVIIRKLEFFREGGSSKHLRDIRGILKNDQVSLDEKFLRTSIQERGLEKIWDNVAKAE